MMFYRLAEFGDHAIYECTREDAHKTAKSGGLDVRIELVDIPTDKANLALMFSRACAEEKLLRTWALTERGGLREVPNGE